MKVIYIISYVLKAGEISHPNLTGYNPCHNLTSVISDKEGVKYLSNTSQLTSVIISDSYYIPIPSVIAEECFHGGNVSVGVAYIMQAIYIIHKICTRKESSYIHENCNLQKKRKKRKKICRIRPAN